MTRPLIALLLALKRVQPKDDCAASACHHFVITSARNCPIRTDTKSHGTAPQPSETLAIAVRTATRRHSAE